MKGFQNDWKGLYIKGFKSFADLVEKTKVKTVNKEGVKTKKKVNVLAPYIEYREFYTYCLLVLNERRNQTISVNVSLLLEQSPIKFSTTKKKNRELLVDSLMCLKKENIINTANDYSKEYLLGDNLLELRVNYKKLSGNNNTEDDWKGYERIPFDAFFKAKKMQHLYIYYLVKRYDLDGFKCSYSYWATLLDSSLSTAKRYLAEAVDEKVIFVNIGKYENKSRVRQQMNTYKTYCFKDKEKTIQTKIKEVKNGIDKATICSDVRKVESLYCSNPF